MIRTFYTMNCDVYNQQNFFAVIRVEQQAIMYVMTAERAAFSQYVMPVPIVLIVVHGLYNVQILNFSYK